jgi:hypothetical protein
MKKWVIFLATLLLASSLMALPSILAIPVQQIMNRYTLSLLMKLCNSFLNRVLDSTL